MDSRKVYILAASQISAQEPLSEAWMDDPVLLAGQFVPCREPDFRSLFSPLQARRMGPLFKRAMAVSRKVMEDSGIGCPDGIFTGTGLGCIENTWDFLETMCRDGEEGLSPTQFMQSTHNTVGSMIAISTGCHGCNCTYSQDGVSFESALLDAFIQLQDGGLGSALVGAHDEATDRSAALMAKCCPGAGDYPLSEGSVALMLSSGVPEGGTAMCEVADVRVLHRPADLDGIIAEYGAACVLANDSFFSLFGRSFCSSGLGTCAAACAIAAGRYPSVLVANVSGRNAGLVFLKKA